MGALTMSTAEREAFLAELHVGVVSIAVDGEPPMTVPVWYSYAPGGPVSMIIGRTSQKAKAIEHAGCFSLCAQTETAPYTYVTVSGAVTVTEPVDPAERRALAHRYLGPELGDLYVESTGGDATDDIVVRMQPERWLTTDYRKQF
jgi:nitroimidazol reductase NimA-like FMN-containing flavoprotein (pyridoxamine 5'-phosphate oxidase superfamily)